MPCSVVIPCHNGAELTRACIDSLLCQVGGPPDEILLVDNGSTDDTRSLDGYAPCVRVLTQPENLGFAGGVNRGLQAARCDHVLVLNNDTRAAPHLLHELTRLLHSDPRIGAVAPVSNHVKGDAHLRIGNFGRDADHRDIIEDELQQHARVQDTDTLAGLCLLLRRSTVHEVGLFDERFGHGNYEDDDFSLRLRLHGYRLAIARRAFLHHEGHATFQALGLDIREQIGKRLRQFEQKWRDHAAGKATLAALRRDLRAAAAHAAEAQRASPQWLDADLHLGRYHESIGSTELAIRHLRAFLVNCPQHTEALLLLSLSLLQGGEQQAGNELLARTLHTHQPTPKLERYLLQQLGRLAYEQQQPTQAATHFASALELAPDDGELHNWLGLCQLALDDIAAARASFEQAIEHGQALAHTNLGICEHRQGRVEAAAEHFEKAVELLPHDPVARRNYEAGVAARELLRS